jgi:hypothetical protein
MGVQTLEEHCHPLPRIAGWARIPTESMESLAWIGLQSRPLRASDSIQLRLRSMTVLDGSQGSAALAGAEGPTILGDQTAALASLERTGGQHRHLDGTEPAVLFVGSGHVSRPRERLRPESLAASAVAQSADVGGFEGEEARPSASKPAAVAEAMASRRGSAGDSSSHYPALDRLALEYFGVWRGTPPRLRLAPCVAVALPAPRRNRAQRLLVQAPKPGS